MDLQQNALVKKLTQGKEFTMQLKSLGHSASRETQVLLVEKILSSYGEALSILGMDAKSYGKAISTMNSLGSPCSFVSSSPRSESKHDSKAHDAHKGVCKKRKRLPCLTERVRVLSSSGLVLEGPLDDGYSWRKYGQKGILGANFPRGYYRCTHRYSQGCLATKLVQRLDEDPALVEITYKGQHTCMQASQKAVVASEVQKTEELKDGHQQVQQKQENSQEAEDMFKNFEAGGLNIETENLDNMEDIFSSYSFTSNFILTDNFDNNDMEFLTENELNGVISPAFASPGISEPSYLSSVSPCHMNSFGLSHTESDLGGIISGPASVANSPTGDFSSLLDGLDSLPIDDNSDLFSLFFSGMPSQL